MASLAYPLLRPSRQRRWRLPALPWRGIALAVLAAALALGGLALARRVTHPDPQALIASARANFAAGNYHAALSNARAAIAAGAIGSEPNLLLARTALRLDDGLAAEAELDRAQAAGAPAAVLHPWRAHARLLQGDAAGALAEAARAPNHPEAARVRARALAASDDPAAATVALERMIAQRPSDAAAWTDLARLRLTLGDVGGAAQAAGRAVPLARGEPATLTLAGEIVRTRFGPRASLPWFAAALKRDAFYHPALIEQAATLGELGRYSEMLALSRRALVSRPGSPQALYLQAVLAARARRPELARRLLQLTGGAIDGVPGVLLLGGSLDLARGDHDQAVARWRRLVEAQPMNIAARRLLALGLLRSGDARGALDVLRPQLFRADADAYTLRLAARALERLGDRAAAARLLDRAASGAGESTPFRSDAAVGALAAAASGAPGDPTYQIGLIRGLLSNGDRAEAVARARALAAASPGAPAARLALGDALIAAGRRREAAQAYASAADLAFDAPTMLRLVDALGRGGAGKEAAISMALYLGQNPRAIDARRILARWQVEAGDHGAAIVTLQGLRRALGDRDAALLADLARAHAGIGRGPEARHYGQAAYRLAPMNAYAITAYAAALDAAGDRRSARQLAAKARAVAGGSPAS